MPDAGRPVRFALAGVRHFQFTHRTVDDLNASRWALRAQHAADHHTVNAPL